MTRPVLIDTDPGNDDAVALALALASDELEVVGVTTVAGNTTVGNATRNALGILALFDREVPVVPGCGRPLAHDLETAEEIHGPGGIRGGLPDAAGEPAATDAPTFIREQAAEHGDDLTIVGLGPLTNLAAALMVDPGIADRVGEVAVMGGVVRATGNRTPMAEANFYSDPAAARRVVWDADPRVVGLNATHDAEVPPDAVAGDSAAAAALRTWLDYYPEEVRESIGLDHAAQHDAAVIADLFADLVTYERAPTDVVLGDGAARGAVVFDEYGVTDAERTARVGVGFDAGRFRSLLGERLSRLA